MAHNGGGSTRFHRIPGTAVSIGSSSSSARNPPSPLLPRIAFSTAATTSSSVLPTAMTTVTNHSPVPHFDRIERGEVITLAQPRPGIDRIRNEYIETPLRPLNVHNPLLTHHHHHSSHRPINHHTQNLPFLPIASKGSGKLDVSGGRISPCLTHTNVAGVHRTISGPSSLVGAPNHHPQRILYPSSPSSSSSSSSSASSNNTHLSLPITVQPLSGNNRMLIGAFNKKDPLNSKGAQVGMGLIDSNHGDDHQQSSIICSECKKCKCDACRIPRPLPATWICGNKYQCSAETFVESVSCMCCVKGLFYHCAKDCEMDDDVSCADRPCSCSSHRRCSRFACIALLSTLLPCLLCYWPLRGCLRLCELCYTKYHSQGCQCVKRNMNKGTASSTLTSNSKGSAALTQQGNNKLEPVRSGKSKRLLDAQID